MARKLPVSTWTLVSLVVVAALSVVSWAVIRSGVAHQNDALVKSGAGQAALLLESAAGTLQTELRSVSYFTSASGDSATVFAAEAKPLLASPRASVALVDISGPTPKLLLGTGPAFPSGKSLDPTLSATVSRATPTLVSAVVHVSSQSYLVITASSTVVPKLVAVSATPLDPSKVVPNDSGPYRNYFIDVFNGSQPRAADLIATTYGTNPLPQPVATSVVRFGGLAWLIEAAPKSPPAGAYAMASPWITLGVGLLVTLVLAASVETLVRRNEHSARLVAERTAELLEAQRTIIRQERLAAVGEMAAVIGHELRNPMAAALNNVYLARMALGDPAPPEAQRHLTGVEHQVNRAAQISEDLTAYIRERKPRFSDVEFTDLVSEVLESTPVPDGVAVSIDATARLSVDPTLMAQVLTNVITNAYQAMPEGGTVRLAARSEPFPVVTVEDTGPGFDPEIAGRLFDPFFTTKQGGTGLGLAIVQRIVEAHGGEVSIDNGDSGGAKVTIAFPARVGARP